MHLTPFFGSFYVLSSLWGVPTASEVCTAKRPALSSVVYGAIRSSVQGGVTAFIDVAVVPMDTERVLPHQTVLVEDGRIIALGPVSRVQVPAGAMRVDGRGKYLMPGLADMHEHKRSGHNLNYDQQVRVLFSYLAHGVTTVRYAGADRTGMWRHFKAAVEQGTIPGPHLYVASPIQELDSLRSLYLRPNPPKELQGPRLDSIASYVAAAKAAGGDYVWMEDVDLVMQTRFPEWRGVTDSLRVAAYRLDLPVAVHSHTLPFEQQLRMVGAGRGSVDHMYLFRDILERPDTEASAAEIQARAMALRRARVWVTPTLDCVEGRKSVTGNIKVARQIVKALQETGVGLLVGADADGAHGVSPVMVHEELKELVSAGLTPYQALLAGTRNVAEYLGLLDSSGTVVVGKRADLVLLYGNPLQNIRHTREPAGVMINGHWYSRAALDERLLAAPKSWFWLEVKGGHYREAVMGTRFMLLADSLELARPPAYERLLEQMTEELGALRAKMTPEQRAAFDPTARVWMRGQARRGHAVVVPGIAPVP